MSYRTSGGAATTATMTAATAALWPYVRRRNDYASIRTPITVPTQETLLCFGQQKHVLHGHWENLILQQSPICKKLCIMFTLLIAEDIWFFCHLYQKFIPPINI